MLRNLNGLILVVLGLVSVVVATEANARAMARSRLGSRGHYEMQDPRASPELTAYESEDPSESQHAGAYTINGTSERPERPEREQTKRASPFRSNALRVGAGTVYGLSSTVADGAAFMYGADVLLQLGRQGFVSIGMSKWEGYVETKEPLFEGTTFSVLTADVGLGYNIQFGRRFAMPVGMRLGWYEMALNLVYDGATEEGFKDYGKTVTPFLGLMYAPSARFAFGLESRVPVFLSNNHDKNDERDSDEDEERGDKPTKQYPSYHLFSITVAI